VEENSLGLPEVVVAKHARLELVNDVRDLALVWARLLQGTDLLVLLTTTFAHVSRDKAIAR
jgi:hypothetical protein